MVKRGERLGDITRALLGHATSCVEVPDVQKGESYRLYCRPREEN